MGNFEKLSVLVIVVIIVMILVVALYTWTDSGDATSTTATSSAEVLPVEEAPPPPAPPKGKDAAKPDRKVLDEIFNFGPKDWPLQANPPKEEKGEASPPPAPGGDAKDGPAAPAGPTFDLYEVKAGDTLGKIAQDRLGGASKWPLIVKENPGLVPESLREGMKIKLPVRGAAGSDDGKAIAKETTPQGSAKPGGSYSVSRGETLQTIAKKVYGRMDRWPEIWVKNLNLLDDPSDIRAGMTLQLPN